VAMDWPCTPALGHTPAAGEMEVRIPGWRQQDVLSAGQRARGLQILFYHCIF